MIRWASQMGIVTGFQDGSFRPNENVTRVQLAAMLFRFAQYQSRDIQGRGDLNSYQDSSSVQAWAKEAIQWAVAKGLISGKSAPALIRPVARPVRRPRPCWFASCVSRNPQ